MAGNQPPPPDHHGLVVDDFFEQILADQPSAGYGGVGGGGGRELVGSTLPMMGLQLGPTNRSGSNNSGSGVGVLMPLGLNLEHQRQHGFSRQQEEDGFVNTNSPSNSATSAINLEGDASGGMTSFFPGFGHLQAPSLHPPPKPAPQPQPPQLHQAFQSQPTSVAVPAAHYPPTIRPRVRARRGQATDPHSIAERLRRERIAERMKALQELVPTANKTDRAAMLDEIVDYVKFLRLQVKVLSMSRMGATGAVAQLVADVPPASVQGEGIEGANDQPWEKWSGDGTEQQVVQLMEEDIGAAMQFLQSKALCIMPVSLASAIFRSHPPDPTTLAKPESNSSSQA